MENESLQNILSIIGCEYIGKDYEKLLLRYGFGVSEINCFKKYGPYIFWHYALKEFITNKTHNSDWEFNYLAMSFLRFAITAINDFYLQRKMIDFIENQSIEGANNIIMHIENIIAKNLIENLYKKLAAIKSDTKTKELYIVGGANGTGKSTLAQQIIASRKLIGKNLVFINADEIAKELNPKDVQKARIKAGKETLKRTYGILDSKQSFILESTLSGKIKDTKYSLPIIINTAEKYGYKVKLFYIHLNNELLCKERIKVRTIKGGHFVPDFEVERRYKRSLKNFFFYKNLVHEWVLYSNDTEDFVEIAKFANETIEFQNEEYYNKIKEAIS